MTTTLEFDNDSSLEMNALEVEMPPEAVMMALKGGDIMSWKKKILKSIEAPCDSIVGLGMTAYKD
jgi:hypothetical protein